MRTEARGGSARRRITRAIGSAVTLGLVAAATRAESNGAAGAPAGSGFERSFEVALRNSGALAGGPGAPPWSAVCLESGCLAMPAPDETSLPEVDLTGPPAPEKKPKKAWIAAASVATVLGSAYNSFSDGPNQRWHFLNEAFFSRNTYAGGADKTSHFVSYYVVAKLLAEVYQGLGLPADRAQPLAAGVSVFAGFVTELGDGRGHYGFSYEDFVFDVLSSATYLGIAHYGLDDLVGFSIGPLAAPGKPAGCCDTPDFGTGVPRFYDFGQDYSTTISSGNFKIAGLSAHTGLDPGPARFLLLSLTYTSKGYRYYPDRDLTERQIGMFVGLNFVEILKLAKVPENKLWGKALYFLFDVIRIPYTQIGYVYDLNHGRWHGPGIGSYPTGSAAAVRTISIP